VAVDRDAAEELLERELEALRAAAAGQTVRQDADARNYSPAWVKHQRGAAIRKLGARNVTEAVTLAVRRGIL
jgi:DNA-binding NarL/FixJ family response regulator